MQLGDYAEDEAFREMLKDAASDVSLRVADISLREGGYPKTEGVRTVDGYKVYVSITREPRDTDAPGFTPR